MVSKYIQMKLLEANLHIIEYNVNWPCIGWSGEIIVYDVYLPSALHKNSNSYGFVGDASPMTLSGLIRVFKINAGVKLTEKCNLRAANYFRAFMLDEAAEGPQL